MSHSFIPALIYGLTSGGPEMQTITRLNAKNCNDMLRNALKYEEVQVKCVDIQVKCEEMQQYATKCNEMQRNASYMQKI